MLLAITGGSGLFLITVVYFWCLRPCHLHSFTLVGRIVCPFYLSLRLILMLHVHVHVPLPKPVNIS
jgi:hypothetical protein